MKSTAKELKEQKRRARESLELAMTNSTIFEYDELITILRNPVLAPLVQKLVWISDNSIGFPSIKNGDLALENVNGETAYAGAKLRIAHPHDLRSAGDWADYMHFLYEKRITQPFKQIFREYYPITDE